MGCGRRIKGISKEKKKELRDEKKRNDLEWKRKKAERKELLTKRKIEDEEWRSKRKEISEQVNAVITSLVAVLVREELDRIFHKPHMKDSKVHLKVRVISRSYS